MRKILFTLSVVLFSLIATAQNRWQIDPVGSITWRVTPGEKHEDHIEMAGQSVAAVLRYGVREDGGFKLERSMIFPMLRTIPNDTHGSLMQRFGIDVVSQLIINGRALSGERVEAITLDGMMSVRSTFDGGELCRTIFPSTTQPALVEGYSIKNMGTKAMTVLVPNQRAVYQTPRERGVEGAYTMVQSISGDGTYIIAPQDSVTFFTVIQAHSPSQSEVKIDYATEKAARREFVDQVWSSLVLETPDENINRALDFAKIRAAESIYKTKGGYMHSPGGESYYAAIWANDEAEYINPFFPFLGYAIGNESVRNSFSHFARFMNDEYKPIPSSIIAEGDDIWNGAGDRGDAAMIAYGAARYALCRGDKAEARELWPLIEWCLEYSRRQTNSGGVIASDRDELEGRFPAGSANLCTSSLHYDALISAAYLGAELGVKSSQLNAYRKEASALKANIEKYFGAKVEGFDTYQYYDGNDVLRSWICIPLTVGIYDRAAETTKALFSDRLWTKDGLLTAAGSETFWDRSTLYALRGVFAAGYADVANEYLKKYSETRLLGNHVPYPIEAYPEGGQRHLSAESGLYARIITEGMFGIRPTGLNSFELAPQMPKDWNTMALRKIKAFGSDFDIEVTRTAKGATAVKVLQNGKVIKEGLSPLNVKILTK